MSEVKLGMKFDSTPKDLVAISKAVSNSVTGLRQELQERLATLRESQEETTVELRNAAAQGDRSENAEYTAAVEKIAQVISDITSIEEQLDELSFISETDYFPIGKVVMYSTVELALITEDITEEAKTIAFKVYPRNISDITRSILARNSRIGRAIWLREAGTTFKIDNKRTGKPVEFRIVNIY